MREKTTYDQWKEEKKQQKATKIPKKKKNRRPQSSFEIQSPMRQWQQTQIIQNYIIFFNPFLF